MVQPINYIGTPIWFEEIHSIQNALNGDILLPEHLQAMHDRVDSSVIRNEKYTTEQIPLKQRAVEEAKIDKMLKEGVIEQSTKHQESFWFSLADTGRWVW